MRRLYYELNEKGYEMFDGNDSDFYINYREPGKDAAYYEKSATEIMHKIKVPEYVQMLSDEVIGWTEVPAEYYNAVQDAIVNII